MCSFRIKWILRFAQEVVKMRLYFCLIYLLLTLFNPIETAMAQVENNLIRFKEESAKKVEEMQTFTQEMVDMIFSFGELGFQEIETSSYITKILEENEFTVERGIAGIPTAWMATWGTGKPVIALGSDIDGIPKTSQKPGVAYKDPLLEGAPGHGEGHNAGQAVNLTAAIAVKEIMEREGIPGTLKLWPGVAEEQLGSKAYFVRDGFFEDVDIVLFSHVSNNLSVQYGPTSGSGLVSIEFTFHGEAAHGAGAPWRGRSALDAVELMNIGWNYRREHLRLQQRSHYVIPNGGDQPNVVPSEASVWYFFRETDYPHIADMLEAGQTMAAAAAMMTDTEVDYRILGSAWPGHFNKIVAETMYENIRKVGLPEWSKADQTLAKALQAELGNDDQTGLAVKIKALPQPIKEPRGGGSDDIGDISWNVPTVTLRFPSNIPGLPGHHWANAVAMATPIAHKGATAGAKVQAMTILDFLFSDDLVNEAWKYFREVQSKEVTYTPFISDSDVPAVHLNREIMETYRDRMREHYFDPSRYNTYLEQLGIEYPTTRN